MIITCGDPAGIGDEIIIKALKRSSFGESVRVIGHAPSWERILKKLKFSSFDQFIKDHGIIFEAVADDVKVPDFAKASAEGGTIALSALQRAWSRLQKEKDFLVTAPLCKESLKLSGVSYAGHTAFFAAQQNQAVAMMLAGPELRVLLLTEHIPLQAVSQALRTASPREKIEIAHRDLSAMIKHPPRIHVLAVNPHAGDGGVCGEDDQNVLQPLIEELSSCAFDITGPYPADAYFARRRWRDADLVVAAYHDQGLIPIKMISPGESVNITLGLPFVRVSPDHGTAFDIAGCGQADESPLCEAIKIGQSWHDARFGSEGF